LKNTEIKKNLLFYSAFVGSAAMLTVIQPPIGWAFLAWVAFVPFILVCSPQAKPRQLAIWAYVISLCYWLGNLYWVFPVTIVGWAAFCLYTAFLWPILALCIRFCRIKNFPLFLAAPILIVAIERMQGLFLGGFFWRFLAHSQYQNIALIQIADIFGAGGVSFLIGMFNGLLAELILDSRLSIVNRQSSIINIIKAVLVCLTVIAAFAYGRWRIAQSDKFVEPGPLVASLQSNIPQSVKRSFSAENEIFDGLMEQSKAAAQAGAELIIWPETMVQAILDSQVWPFLASAEDNRAFDKALREHSEKTAFVLVGAYGGRIQQDSDGSISLARYNSAFLYRPDGQQDGRRYDKIHLVPFGEVLPLRKTLSWFYRLLMKVKFIPYNFDYSLDYGSEYTVFEMTSSKEISHEDIPASAGTSSPLRRQGSQSQLDISKKQKNSSGLGVLVAENNRIYKFSVIICYEDVFPAVVRGFTLDKKGQKRIDWLVNISNDGWFVKFSAREMPLSLSHGLKDIKVSPSAELPQHAAICAFRAVENRLPIVRSVNTGISCLIDSLGRIRDDFLAGTLPHKAMDRTAVAGWFTDRIPIDKRTTFFSKNGQFLDFCCQICLALLIIIGLSAKFLTRQTCGELRNKKCGHLFGRVTK
jgi:apolipoprotein N-acyltransferase